MLVQTWETQTPGCLAFPFCRRDAIRLRRAKCLPFGCGAAHDDPRAPCPRLSRKQPAGEEPLRKAAQGDSSGVPPLGVVCDSGHRHARSLSKVAGARWRPIAIRDHSRHATYLTPGCIPCRAPSTTSTMQGSRAHSVRRGGQARGCLPRRKRRPWTVWRHYSLARRRCFANRRGTRHGDAAHSEAGGSHTIYRLRSRLRPPWTQRPGTRRGTLLTPW